MATVDSVQSAVRAPRPSTASLVPTALREIWSRRRLIRYVVKADLVKKGSDTILGNIWWVLDPVLQMAVYVILVTVILKTTKEAYPLFIFCAILPWKWFTSSVGDAITSVTGREKIIKQVNFPKVVLPVAAVVSGIVNFAFGLIPLALILIVLYPNHLSSWPVLIPIVAFVQFFFTLAVATALSAVNVFYRDVGNLMRHLLRLWFYLSPALYGADQITSITEKSRAMNLLFTLNPWSAIFESYRNLIYYGTAPVWGGLAYVLVLSLVLCGLAIILFKRLEPAFAKVL
jgi:ABC-type polysaccharide/polyol phosphate export permease